MTGTLKISALVADPEGEEWLEYPQIPGFRVRFSPLDNPAQVRLATRAAMLKPLSVPQKGKTDVGEAADQNALYQFLQVQEQVAGWEGLKVADLPKLFPGRKLCLGEAPETAELGFNQDNLDFLMVNSRPFYAWVNARVNAREALEEADSKN